MAKQMVQLLCLLVALVLTDGKWDTNDPVEKFYCETDDFKKVGLYTLKHEINLLNCCTRNLNDTQVGTVMNHFNKTCKTFTAINAFKYQLQHYLFHDADATLLKNIDLVKNLTLIMIGLQSAARYLQDIAITEGTTCVKFTPTQFRKLYESGLLPYADNDKLSTTKNLSHSLDKAIRKWIIIGNAITNGTLPRHNCKLL